MQQWDKNQTMKTQTCLYVREDGKILIGEFLDPPYMDDSPIWNATTDKAKESAAECADQDAAWRLIFRYDSAMQKMTNFKYGHNYVDYREGNSHHSKTVKPGVYPIPGIRYEVREEIIQKADRIKCGCPCHIHTDIKHVVACCENGYVDLPEWKEKLAHIITSVVAKKEESQDELWAEVFTRILQDKVSGIRDEFHITRK